jgi:hypothetical protein
MTKHKQNKMNRTINEKDFLAIGPGYSGDKGYFSWIRREGRTEEVMGKSIIIDPFSEVFIVVARGTIETEEDGRLSSATPVKYCNTIQEAVTLVNKLNSAIGTKDLSLPYAECPDCGDSENIRQSTAEWKKGELLIFHCPACEIDFQPKQRL